MSSDTDLHDEQDSIQQKPPGSIINKNFSWKRFFIVLFFINLINPALVLLYFILNQLRVIDHTSYGGQNDAVIRIFSFFFKNSGYIAFALLTIDIISLSIFLVKQRPKGKSKVITIALLAILIFWLISSAKIYFDLSTKLTPVSIAREEALKHIMACNVGGLKRYHDPENRIVISITGDELPSKLDKLNNARTVADNDFAALLEAARTVKDRCGYEFGGFNPGIEGFQSVPHAIYIPREEAVRLVASCTVDTVIYGDPAGGWKRITGVPSGIQLWSKENPSQIWVQEGLKAETFSIFQEAKKTCPNLKILGP